MCETRILSNNLEEAFYNFKDFPIYVRQEFISNYPGMSAVNHWHTDWEFILILDGRLSYSVNGQNYDLQKGQAIFVNSEQMHYGYSPDGNDCQFICVRLSLAPISLLSLIHEKYVIPICRDNAHPYFILRPEISWQRELIEMLKLIYTLCTEEKDGFELRIMSILYSLSYSLYINVRNNTSLISAADDKKIMAMHNMVGYIQENYQKKITLNEIAQAGNVCRSSCCDIFQLILNKTPVSYLTEYRLEKSLELLNIPSLSITDIALQCGFTGSSYFTEIFHKKLGCTPSQYRKKKFKI